MSLLFDSIFGEIIINLFGIDYEEYKKKPEYSKILQWF